VLELKKKIPLDIDDIEKLVGSENFHSWAFAMKNYLDLKGFSNCITDPVTEEKTK